MKRLGGIWPRITAFDNLLLAWRRARRGKRQRPVVAAFALDLERELLRLQEELRSGAYRPGEYRQFTLYERKPRLISAAPFRDRVVHHALMNIIEPALDRRFFAHSYACRRGKGVHAAVARYQGWCRRYPYALKVDVQRYFPSIDHERMKEKLRRLIKDGDALALLDRIIDGSPPSGDAQPLQYFNGDDLLTPVLRPTGLPIGNLTSQFFANVYLNDLDWYIKQQLRVRAYLRYVDDLILLGYDKASLHRVCDAIQAYLAQERLRLHPNKILLQPTAKGLDVFGYRVFPDFRLLRNDNGHRFQRRLRALSRAYARGEVDLATVEATVQSWIGHASHADTLGLRAAVFEGVVFRKG